MRNTLELRLAADAAEVAAYQARGTEHEGAARAAHIAARTIWEAAEARDTEVRTALASHDPLAAVLALIDR